MRLYKPSKNKLMSKWIAFALMMLTTLSAFTQSSRDSITCIPNSQHRLAIEEIIRGRAAMRENALLRRNDTIWAAIVSERDSIISLMRSKEGKYAAIEDGYVQRIKLAEQQHELTKQWAGELSGKLKRQRRRTLLWSVGGILATGASIYFLR
jgi:hypothetical protein